MGGMVIGDRKRIRAIKPLAVNMGAVLDPGAAFLIARGLKTYYLRYERQSANALAIAEYLAKRKEVTKVFYPGLPGDPGHALARKQMERLRRRARVRSRRRQGAHVGVHRRARAVHDDGELGLDGVARVRP